MLLKTKLKYFCTKNFELHLQFEKSSFVSNENFKMDLFTLIDNDRYSLSYYLNNIFYLTDFLDIRRF